MTLKTRIAAARAAAERLQRASAAHPGNGGTRQCPAYPLPPAELLKPPVKTNFLPPTP
jgi:hypothetical protein